MTSNLLKSNSSEVKIIDKRNRVGRWYFGGIASAGAALCTHPLDLIKVHMQTSSKFTFTSQLDANVAKPRATFISTTVSIVRHQGFFVLYNGLTASLLRQLTYSTTRFAIYETVKKEIMRDSKSPDKTVPFYQKVLLASVSGAVGGLFGAPADMINVRMQNDVKLPIEMRRNYKHAIDGLYQVLRFEGFKSVFNGASMATSRAVLMTVGQLSIYDQFKYLLLTYCPSVFQDNLLTHFTGSIMAGAVATTLTQPLDVMKTRLMNAVKGEYKSILDCGKKIFIEAGPMGFFKGYVPAFVRLGPQTILTFIFFEQLRINFGDNL